MPYLSALLSFGATVGTASSGAIRLDGSRVEFWVPSDDGRVIDVGFDVSDRTSHALRHLLAAPCDPRAEQPLHGSRRTLLERTLQAAGGAIERVEVLPGDPPRLALAIVTPNGVIRRIDLDLLDTAELLARHRVPAVAVGWPEGDWDLGMRELLG